MPVLAIVKKKLNGVKHDKLKKFEKQVKDIANLNEKVKKLENSLPVKCVKNMKCGKCEFETSSERGLKVHMKREHTAFSADKFPLTCDLCDETVKCNKYS